MENSQPISDSKRIVSLDVIRGVALLGILIMNIQAFSMPGAAYLNPTAYGDLQGANFYTWLVSHVFADMKFMGIFSMLFGAGILVFCERAEQKHASVAKYHYRRNFWLLIFGLVHAHFIWYGDILFPYAMCAFIAYWFRNLSAKALFIWAAVFLIIGSGYNLLIGFSLSKIPPEAIAEINESWLPSTEKINQEITAYQGDVVEQFQFRHPYATFMQTQVFFTMFIWRILGMMCIGMAFFKLGIFSASKSNTFYYRLALVSAVIGFALIGYGASQNIEHEFSMEFSFFLGSQFNFWGSILISWVYIALLCIWIRSGGGEKLKTGFANIGKMAFTNYILHSLVFTFIFYGHGLGLYGEVERISMVWMILAMWVFQFFFSSFWLARFKFGPLEWAWRCLTYWKFQPMRIR